MNRIQYLDCMRGFTMILVVYSHLIIFGYQVEGSSLMNWFSIAVMMPLFFWISGYLAYTSFSYHKLIGGGKLKRRLLCQLLPTFVMLSLHELWIGHHDFSGFTNTPKNGYWFTIVLFQLFLFYAGLECLLDNFHASRRKKAIVYAIIAMGLYRIGYFFPVISHNSIAPVLSLPFFTEYAPFFCFVIICKMYNDKYIQWFTNKWVASGCLLIFALAYILAWPKTICNFTAIVFINAAFHHYQGFFNSETTVGKTLSYIGRNTLPIYFLHYFSFKYLHLHELATWLMDSNVELLGVFISLLLVLFIISLCLLTERFLSVFKPIHALMFGPKM